MEDGFRYAKPPEQETAPPAPDSKLTELQDGRKYWVSSDPNVQPRLAGPDVQAPPEPAPAPEVAPGPDVTGEAALRKEFSGLSAGFRKRQSGFRSVLAASKRDSAAGDHALIFSYMKTQDPDSVVRESEFDIAQSLGSIPQRLRAAATQVANGERLTPQQRQDFVDTSNAIYMDHLQQQQEITNQYSTIAESYGYTPSRVIVNFVNDSLQATAPAAPAGAGLPDFASMSEEDLQRLAMGG